jgi:hypothetical protein
MSKSYLLPGRGGRGGGLTWNWGLELAQAVRGVCSAQRGAGQPDELDPTGTWNRLCRSYSGDRAWRGSGAPGSLRARAGPAGAPCLGACTGATPLQPQRSSLPGPTALREGSSAHLVGARSGTPNFTAGPLNFPATSPLGGNGPVRFSTLGGKNADSPRTPARAEIGEPAGKLGFRREGRIEFGKARFWGRSGSEIRVELPGHPLVPRGPVRGRSGPGRSH